ncbi:MAG: ABC transporter permease [Kofleriaceae bacterium]|nr:ABC transporter permease [Kofleriaceae bacterium]
MIGAAIKKDVWLLLRDRGALISLFLLPIIFILAFGSMFKFGGENAGHRRAIAIWYAPGDSRGDRISATLAKSESLEGKPLASADEVRHAVATETYDAGLVVPAEGPVELVIDLGAPLQARGPLQGALTGVVMSSLMPPLPVDMPPLVVAKTPPGITKPLDNISAFQVTVPGNATLFGFFIALTVAMAFTGERRTGTWRRLLAAPVSRASALLATLVPYYIVGCCQLAFLFGIGILAFGMQVAGSPLALIVLCLALAFCSVSLGLLFASLGGSEKQLGGIGSVVLLVMGLLGGCMFPRLVMPPFMKTLGLAVPHGWALDGFYAVLVRQGTTLGDVAPSIFALLAFGAGFALLGVALFKFER